MLAVIVFVASLAASVIAGPVTAPILKLRDFPVDPYDLESVIPVQCGTICGYVLEAYNGCQDNDPYICNMICGPYGENQMNLCVDCVTGLNQTHPDLVQSGIDAVHDYC